MAALVQQSAKTFAQPDPARVANSLASQVRHQIGVSERSFASFMLADFDDALRAAATDPDRVMLCRTWLARLRAVRKDSYG